MTVRLTLLVAGACRQIERVARRGGRWRSVQFPALVGVIEHPTAGVMLFDTGYSPRFFAETARGAARLYRWLTPPTCTAQETAAAQLTAAGISPYQVKIVVISHFHADHIGGLADFPAARFLYLRSALRPAWRTRSSVSNVRHAFLPGLLPPGFEERSISAEDCPAAPPPPGTGLDPGFDLLGDGSLLGFDLSGHVAGQLGLFLPQTQGPPVMLVGDACWHRRAFTHGELPHPVARLVTADPRAYRQRIETLGRLARARPDLLVVPSHCETSIGLARQALGE
ncbi:MAG: MBL fold metallo-hydrolase [Dactylosporangium sp.]|nr:MBL fold metallo-hydrolase [Dactylosporangium sp.]NNJ62265.1 MBL fold metallo-hydrolase [Dactylosporangium sp.]